MKQTFYMKVFSSILIQNSCFKKLKQLLKLLKQLFWIDTRPKLDQKFLQQTFSKNLKHQIN